MLGGRKKQPLGYTIVEVMIVLAISGLMLAIASSFISSKQAVTAFRTGVNTMASNIQDVIEQVTDGQYTDINFTCNDDTSLTFDIGDQSDASTQGTNPSCTFLGKFIYFNATQQAQYKVFSLALARNATDLSSAAPIIGNGIDLTDQETTPYNLKVTKVLVNLSSQTSGTQAQGFGFVQDPTSGSDQSIEMVYMPSMALPNSSNDSDFIGSFDGATQLTNTTSADICVSDGTRYALIELGDNNGGSQLSANAQFLPDAATGLNTCGD